LDEFLLSKENQIINVPDKEYTILIKVGNNLIYKKDSYYQTFFILICSFIFLISIISFLLKIRIYNKFNTK
jgi:hypothetical protein